ncbi:AAA family ATPase [Megamonas funiformis]|jgi:hypothetical protein|uniref:AAA family ATPase n=1 Tax=Megamonas funiformis TaxID=437897 RepID=UPI0022E59378|nr:AAA family ATPase [Megamonas funiformis]
MYLKHMIYENIGPIDRIDIKPSFDEKNEPIPMIVVGENGTGKSILLSNIVDSLYELAAKYYTNACISEYFGHQYYKIISPQQIKIDKTYMYSYLKYEEYENNTLKPIEYIFKSGNYSLDDLFKKNNIQNQFLWNANNLNNDFKEVMFNLNNVQDIFTNNVICYFGPNRYEAPHWMGEQYYLMQEYEHLTIMNKSNAKLITPITVKNVTKETLQWLLDVIADSKIDPIIFQSIQNNSSNLNDALQKLSSFHQNLQVIYTTRYHLEEIMSIILGQPIFFDLNYRNTSASRFNIKNRKTQKPIVETLDSLSTGQLALFNIFATIIRYADINDMSKSIDISKITGIVIIDEIELHLHSSLQKNVLPKLIKIFPKVQFIITTHSPLFLLGMEEAFSSDKYDIYQMPRGEKISVERFSEFNKAFQFYSQTNKYHDEIKKAISKTKKALVITEGSTDWKHLKAAFNNLKSNTQYSSLFDNLDFDFLEYQPSDFNMGADTLASMCENFSRIKQERKLIFIADRDIEKINKKLSSENHEYKNWGNNVFSFILPLPDFRKDTPNICIEHLYTDKEIKTEMICDDGITRRLYMGNEFNKHAHTKDNKYCTNRNACGPDKISIIEGSSKDNVLNPNDDNSPNYALPKSKFADYILNRQKPFDNFNFDNFLPIFKIIKQILDEPLI